MGACFVQLCLIVKKYYQNAGYITVHPSPLLASSDLSPFVVVFDTLHPGQTLDVNSTVLLFAASGADCRAAVPRESDWCDCRAQFYP